MEVRATIEGRKGAEEVRAMIEEKRGVEEVRATGTEGRRGVEEVRAMVQWKRVRPWPCCRGDEREQGRLGVGSSVYPAVVF